MTNASFQTAKGNEEMLKLWPQKTHKTTNMNQRRKLKSEVFIFAFLLIHSSTLYFFSIIVGKSQKSEVINSMERALNVWFASIFKKKEERGSNLGSRVREKITDFCRICGIVEFTWGVLGRCHCLIKWISVISVLRYFFVDF